MPVDPEVQEVLDEAARLAPPDFDTLSPDEARREMLALAPPVDPERAARLVEDRRLPGPRGEIPVRLYHPPGDDVGTPPVTVYFHGGGWVVGCIETHHALCHALAAESACLVASVDYRLAPEHPFPAAVDDALVATRWLAENAATVGADGGRLAVAGDSAGGNLAAVVSLLARDLGGPPIRFQALVYPVTDCDLSTASYLENAEGYLLTRARMRWFWDHYIPIDRERESERADPRASPLRSVNVAGLPPALVLTAEFDPLRDEGEAYARRLQESGVPTVLSRYDGVVHGFFRMTARLRRAREALDQVAAALRQAL
ncbi:MAG: alpha/beta hydrolase, partial [Planctomycetota bacterium]|nr:alpha/beta hydrolase [Planctomycetota bacterium]